MRAEAMSTMADGIAVGRPGDVPFGLVAQHVDAMETVSEAALARSVLYLVEHAKLVAEPAGAAATAAAGGTRTASTRAGSCPARR